MYAKIKQGVSLKKLIELGYTHVKRTKAMQPEFYYKDIGHGCYVTIQAYSRVINIDTPMNGRVPFMDAHKEKFKELIDADMIEWERNKFD